AAPGHDPAMGGVDVSPESRMELPMKKNRITMAGMFLLALVLSNVPGTTPAWADSDEETLLTPSGTPLKVVVREAAAVYEQPNKSGASRPIRQFEFCYVLPAKDGTTDKLLNGFYRVASAPRKSAALGWLPQDAALE